MAGEDSPGSNLPAGRGRPMRRPYDPFVRGPFPVGVRTVPALDAARDRRFECEIWYPATAEHAGRDLAPQSQDVFTVPQGRGTREQAAIRDAAAERGTWPLIVFSHSSGGGRRQSTFLCTHLSSHGYVVAALDHSELVAAELAVQASETTEQKTARQAAWMASRVPDIRFLLDYLLVDGPDSGLNFDPARIGIVGHSFGGWTALAAPEVEARISAVVALAPAGSSKPKPGILPAKLSFAWARDVPTLFIAAEEDVSLPLAGIQELFARAPGSKQLVILRRADHLHFMDSVEQLHEAVRAMSFTGDLAWLTQAMRPIAELCSEHDAHQFVRGFTLCHLDAVLGCEERAQLFLREAIEAERA